MAEGQVSRGFCQSLSHFREALCSRNSAASRCTCAAAIRIVVMYQRIVAILVSPCADRPLAYKDGKLSPIGICRSFRFLGGYRDDWLQKFHEWDDRLGRRSLDAAIRRSDGSWQFRPELIQRRLEPYFAAGYRPRDITIALENVPWDLATPDGRPPEIGPWGRWTPRATS